jgi:hypothetical protein
MVSSDASEVIQWTTKCISNFNSTAFDSSIDQFAAENHEAYTTFAVVAIVIGVIMLFFGYSLFYFTLATTGFLVGASAGFFFLCGATEQIVAAGIGGAILGVLMGILIIKLEKIGVAVMGIVGGIIVAMYTNGFVMTHLYAEFSATQKSWVPYAYATLLAIIFMIIAFKLERFLIIAVTSFAGAYAVGFGVIRLAWKSTHADIGPLYLFSAPGCRDAFCKWALLCIVVGGIIGMLVQLYVVKNKNKFSKKTEDSRDVVVCDDKTVLLIQGGQVKALNL